MHDDRLIAMALDALEELAKQCDAGPQPKTKMLAAVLAYLHSRAGGERWPFDSFWKTIADPKDIGRTQNVNASMNGIYNQLGRKRSDLSARKESPGNS
ncbi:MAG: hypothetical protein ABIO43_08580 [Sphingomicrobium sp.]